MMKVAICDNNKEDVNLLKNILGKICLKNNIGIIIDKFDEGEGLVDSYLNGDILYDVIFLETILVGTNGLEVAKEIRKKDKTVKIIFLSNSKKYALEGYEVSAMSYMIKPAMEEKIENNFFRAIEESNKELMDSYKVTRSGKTIVFKLKDIFYFEARQGKVILYTEDNYFEFYEKIDNIEKALSNKGFERCHRSYIVNIAKIREFKNIELVLSNREVIPIGRKYKSNLRSEIL